MVSDTHMPRSGRLLPGELRRGLEASQLALILHLGDLTEPGVAPLFEEIAPFHAVAGNNDGDELRARYGRRRVIEVGGVRLGMVHGDGRGGTTRARALATFADEPLDAVLYGHSHMPYCSRQDDRWVINPGSPTDKRRNAEYSYAILEITDRAITPHLRFYASKSP